MALQQTLLALGVCLLSLIISIGVLVAPSQGKAHPIRIAWVTISAALAYVFACIAVVTYLRSRTKQMHEEDQTYKTVRVSRSASQISLPSSESSQVGRAEEEVHNRAVDSSSGTCHWSDLDFRRGNRIASGESTVPGSPEATVVQYPIRSSSRLPPPAKETVLPAVRVAVSRVGSIKMVSMMAARATLVDIKAPERVRVKRRNSVVQGADEG